jgi:hypothetical protein
MNINKAKVIAREAGLKRYFTGKPCVHGHVCERLVSGGQCVECMKAPTYRKRMALNMKRLRRRVGNTGIEKRRETSRKANRKLRGMPAPTRPSPPLCELCGRPPRSRALNLDHCHGTGEFRGWLCSNCNRGIGMLGDTAISLVRALDYLIKRDPTFRRPT